MRVWRIGKEIITTQKGTVLHITVLEESEGKRYFAKGEVDLELIDFWEMVRDALANVFKTNPDKLEVLRGVYDDLDLLLTKSTKPKRVILMLRDGKTYSAPILVITDKSFEDLQEEVYEIIKELVEEGIPREKISFADIINRLEQNGVIRGAHFDAVYEVRVDGTK